MSPASLEPYWTARDVSRFLSVSAKWVYKHAASGTLPCSRFGANLRFCPSEIRSYAAKCSRKGQASTQVIPFSRANAA